MIEFFVTAARPFVTRSLRGFRKRALLFAAAIAAVMVLLGGAFVGGSDSRLAHEMRVGFDMEPTRWETSKRKFVYFVDSERELRSARAAQEHAERTRSPGRGDITVYQARRGWKTLDTATAPHEPVPAEHRELAERARTLRHARLDLMPPDQRHHGRSNRFNWHNARDVERLEAIVDAQLVPTLVHYESPLSGTQVVALIGVLAGGVLLMLMLVVAPLFAAVVVAQELSENTLQPLTGTALTARQLVVGLAAGAWAPVMIVAAPLSVLMLGSAAIAGRVVPALAAVGLTSAVSLTLTGLGMLIAYTRQGRQGPGIIGIVVLAALGTAASVGWALGLHIESRSLYAVSVVPTAGPIHLLTEALVPTARLELVDTLRLDARLGLTFAATALFSWLLLRALERLVDRTAQAGALRPLEAGLGAIAVIVLAASALGDRLDIAEFFAATVAIAIVPLQLLVASRYPTSETPATWRDIPWRGVVVEHATWLLLALGLAIVAGRAHSDAGAGFIIGVIHLLWVLLVVPLITLRMCGPTTIPAKVWLIICVLFAMLGLGTAAVWLIESPPAEAVLPLGAITPALGVVQLVMLAVIPVTLIQALQGRRDADPKG